MPPARSAWGAPSDNRKRYGGGQNRRSPAPATIRASIDQIATTPRQPVDRSRNNGCPTERQESLPAIPVEDAAEPKGSTDRAPPSLAPARYRSGESSQRAPESSCTSSQSRPGTR